MIGRRYPGSFSSGPTRVLTLLLILASFFQAHANFKDKNWKPSEDEWMGYLVLKKGKMKPIEIPIEANKDKDWVVARYTPYLGNKQRIAVLSITNKAGEEGENIPMAALEDMLTSALFSSNRFNLVERNEMDAILKEQKLSRGGEFTNETAAKVGQLLGVRFIVIGSINEWSPQKKTQGVFGVGGRNLAETAITVKLIDVQTGEILRAITERAKAASWGLGLGVVPGLASTDDSPINYAVSACINKITHRLCLYIKDKPWTGSVIKVSGSTVILNGGTDQGLEVGNRIIVFSKGEPLIDPETGLNLGSEKERLGTLKIARVSAKTSWAEVVEGCRGVKRGDSLELAMGPEK